MRLTNTLKLIAWIVFFELVGLMLGLLTQNNIYPWYESLTKSSLTPPGVVFSIVWPFLYAVLAVIAWILSTNNDAPHKTITTLFILQLLMNWAWTPLFFQLHLLKFSAVWLICLTCLNWVLILKAEKTHKLVALLLIPYVLWLMFASYLNVVIALMN